MAKLGMPFYQYQRYVYPHLVEKFSAFKDSSLQARKFKLCQAADHKCKEHEVLLDEINRKDDFVKTMTNRLLVNPDFVQDLDRSDGSKQFDDS